MSPKPIRPVIWIFLLAGLFLAGCKTTRPGVPPGMEGFDLPPTVVPLYDSMMKEGERNWVLHLNDIAVEALRVGDRDLAKRALDESILLIEAVFGNSPEANRARTLFFDEGAKLFKGDPHERSLTFFYRGILYMQEGDYENARACFLSANYQDAFAEEEQNASDWSLFDYMIGVCEGQLRRPFYEDEAYSRAAKTFESFPANYKPIAGNALTVTSPTLTRIGPRHNLLMIVQSGPAPKKIRSGEFGQYLSYVRKTTGDPHPTVYLDDSSRGKVQTVDSVFYQAVTRGGRPFDKIAGRKVFFKKGSELAGAASAGLGYMVFTQGNDDPAAAVVGLALIGTGVAFTFIAELIKPGADIRQLQTIPDTIGLFQGRFPEGIHKIKVSGGEGLPIVGDVELPPPGRGLAVVLTFSGRQPFLLAPR